MYRWARKKHPGIVALMRAAPNKSLQILEQAKFVVELLTMHGMSVADVAESLSRSKGWVCMRRNLMEQMSDATRADSLPGSVSRLQLHVHAAPVHAHELGSQAATWIGSSSWSPASG